jgi:hypothetical protein
MLTQAASIANDVAASSPLTGLVVPVIVAAVAKNTLDPKFKALLAGLLSLGAALFTADGQIDQATLEQALNNTFMALAAYKGIWTHFNLNGSLFPGRGLGPKSAPVESGDPGFTDDNFEGA